MMAKLKVWQKFALIGAAALMLAGPPAVMHLRGAIDAWRGARAESSGIDPAREVLALVRATQLHRALSSGVLAGDNAQAAAKETQRQAADAALARARLAAGRLASPALDERARTVGEAWERLTADVAERRIDASTSFERHGALIADELAWLEDIVDTSTIALDPEAASYYLAVASLDKIPRGTELLGQVRGRGALVLVRRQLSADDRVRLVSAAAIASDLLGQADHALHKAAAADTAIGKALGAGADEAKAATRRLLATLDGDILSAAELRLSRNDYFAIANRAVEAQYALSARAFDELARLLDRRAARLRNEMIATATAMALALAAGLALMVGVARAVTRAVGDAAAAADALARGDLTRDVMATSADEIGNMTRSMAGATARLRTLVGDVRVRADAVAQASAQIAAGNEDLSSRTESQASSLQQTASAMAQMTATVALTAAHAREAKLLAGEARDSVHDGQQRFDRVAGTMREIDAAGRQIAEILTLIDTLAFQTRLLSLNAAVEAARAGEHGRGFAVVAGDVRSLAARSSEAAVQIRGLIESSTTRTGLGTHQAEEAGVAIAAAVQRIERVGTLLGEISHAADEQSKGIGEVNTAVAQIDHTTQQNAALVEQTAAAARSLSSQAAGVVESVGVFRLAAV